MRRSLSASASLIVVALAGCSAPVPDEQTELPTTASIAEALRAAESSGLDWEADVLRDGTITAGEYEDAYDRYMQCLAEQGYVDGVPKYLDPVNGIQWKSLQPYGGTEDLEVMERTMQVECVDPLQLVEVPYLHVTPQRMEGRLLARFRECLDANGLEHAGTEVNYDEFTTGLTDEEFAYGPHFDCLAESVHEVHPDAIGAGVARR